MWGSENHHIKRDKFLWWRYLLFLRHGYRLIDDIEGPTIGLHACANFYLILWGQSSRWFIQGKVSLPGPGVNFIRKPEVQRFYIVSTFLFEARIVLRQIYHLIFSSISLLKTLRHMIYWYVHPGVSPRAGTVVGRVLGGVGTRKHQNCSLGAVVSP